MSGIISTGTSVQKGVTITTTKKWQHNKGVKPLRVSVIKASNGTLDTAATVVCTNDYITVVDAALSADTANIFVDWDVTTLNASSLAGLPGSTSPSNGFV